MDWNWPISCSDLLFVQFESVSPLLQRQKTTIVFDQTIVSESYASLSDSLQPVKQELICDFLDRWRRQKCGVCCDWNTTTSLSLSLYSLCVSLCLSGILTREDMPHNTRCCPKVNTHPTFRKMLPVDQSNAATSHKIRHRKGYRMVNERRKTYCTTYSECIINKTLFQYVFVTETLINYADLLSPAAILYGFAGTTISCRLLWKTKIVRYILYFNKRHFSNLTKRSGRVLWSQRPLPARGQSLAAAQN